MNHIPWPPKLSLSDKILQKDLFGIAIDIFSIVISRLKFPGVKIIRFPFRINAKRKQIKIGKDAIIGKSAKFDLFLPSSSVNIGDNFTAGDNLSINIVSSLVIGNDVLFSRNVFIIDHSHGNYSAGVNENPNCPPLQRDLYYLPIHIGDNVWIGESVKILKGVKIGNGSIINAGCVISKNVPEHSIISNVPSLIIKKYNKVNKSWVKFE